MFNYLLWNLNSLWFHKLVHLLSLPFFFRHELVFLCYERSSFVLYYFLLKFSTYKLLQLSSLSNHLLILLSKLSYSVSLILPRLEWKLPYLGLYLNSRVVFLRYRSPNKPPLWNERVLHPRPFWKLYYPYRYLSFSEPYSLFSYKQQGLV